MRIGIVLNTAWNIINFRRHLVVHLIKQGHEVFAIAPPDKFSTSIEELGAQFVPIAMNQQGINPIEDLQLTFRLYRCYKALKLTKVLHYTIKPNIYGAFAAKLAGISCINTVTGLGTIFLNDNLVQKVAILLYKWAFRYPEYIIFQNHDDKALYINRIIKKGRGNNVKVILGSGVDMQYFKTDEEAYLSYRKKRNRIFVFLMISRLLIDKGVEDFVNAAKIVKKDYPNAKFILLGATMFDHPRGVAEESLKQWIEAEIIDYQEVMKDVRKQIAIADCVVLPSYREGLPRTLIEAGAMSKPLIATDVAGCREVVKNKINGYLCPLKDSVVLAQKMEQMLLLSTIEREKMGKESYDRTKRLFAIDKIIKEYDQLVHF